MSIPSNVAEVTMDSRSAVPAEPRLIRPLYWSLRRELWENRSLYLAPLAVAALILFGYVISTIGMPHRRRATLLLAPAQQRIVVAKPYDFAATMLLFVALIVGVFYCLDALHGERRDRSILFWKSLPVSDRTTVLSKAIVPLLILPAVTFVIAVATQFIMLLWTTLVLLPSGLAGSTWTRYNFIEQSLILLYGLVVLALWHAPIYGWLLVVSAWARRAAVLWAILPLIGISILEKIATNTSNFGRWLGYRVMGGAMRGFEFLPQHQLQSLNQLTPGRFLSTPGLWFGLLLAAALIALAIFLRRHREPI